MPILDVFHETIYRYARPVGFGQHRMMFRPRDSHDLRIVGTKLFIDPRPTGLRWVYDTFGNSIAIASFEGVQSDTLRFVSELVLEHFEAALPQYPIADYARTYPFSYAMDEIPDLSRLMERHYHDADHAVDLWAKGFVRIDAATDTHDLLVWMTRAIKTMFRYQARDEEGTQPPVETLHRGSGTCRDFALLMMEAVRSLGLAARFVTGYIYSPNAGGAGNVGGGATHAWMEVYLPGAGWVSFDPTNGIVGNRDLIRVAVVRDPRQAIPLAGTWMGDASDSLGIFVDVRVKSR